MRWILIVAVLAGCDPCSCEPSSEIKARAAELSGGFKTQAEKIVAKQDESLTILKSNTTALAAIKGQIEALKVESETPKVEEVIKSAEPQEAPRANLSQPIIPVAPSPAVRLFVSHAPFHCPPCERLERAVTNGEFDGFEVVDGGDFSGLRSYPAIRFETPTTATGWGVLYGYDNSTIPTLRALTGAIKEQPVTLTDRGTRSPVVRIRSTRRGFFGLFR